MAKKRKLPDTVEKRPEQGEAEPALKECVICFQANSTPVELPCACKVSYCTSCWDQSLVASFRGCSTARCPTCRTAVRIDVESSEQDTKCKLRFSVEPRDEKLLNADTELLRLAFQARPVQMQLLKKFRESQSSPSPSADGNAGSQEKTEPTCVCGKTLQRMNLYQRIIESGSSNIVCDLCDLRMRKGSRDLWTCQNKTILHPNAYDVCERCFNQHAVTPASPCADSPTPENPSREEEADDSTSISESSFGSFFGEGGESEIDLLEDQLVEGDSDLESDNEAAAPAPDS